MDRSQKVLVAQAMAFHQGVYVVVSSLGAILNQLKDTKTDSYPTEGVADILNAIESRHFEGNTQVIKDMGILENARWFRSKYVDHPQQHQPHCWHTQYMADDDREYIVFYNPIVGEDFEMPPMEDWSYDPGKVDFRTILGVDQFFVTPDVTLTYRALTRVILHLFWLLNLPGVEKSPYAQ